MGRRWALLSSGLVSSTAAQEFAVPCVPKFASTSTGNPQPSDLPRLDLVTRVVQESLRLYPPAWSFERQATNDDTVMGFTIPAGTLVGICPYILHRSSAWWDEPERFDPDRFLPDRCASRPRYAYLPFGGGPRTCIGASFAMMEAQIIAARVVRLFAFEPTPQRVDLELGVTLRPKKGLRMRVSSLGAAAANAA